MMIKLETLCQLTFDSHHSNSSWHYQRVQTREQTLDPIGFPIVGQFVFTRY